MSTGETRWQLFNQCSKAMLQTYLGHINTRGVSSRLCLTDFNVKVNRLGMFQLQHAQSRKYVCFNRRRRVTVRIIFVLRMATSLSDCYNVPVEHAELKRILRF
ncbi:hypothetical protein NECAME_02850 [Necator americanus]|uniref:Uncharacterized protein n=1 Tax=Necator americanus TaxID=51031 RepID=W2TCG1_NECAM|nr:hypothetical protein NECAME_02850 [Necator americanus]ETN78702.1 hypothetical protein NECAME_02850 [Necator americanus]